MILCERRAVELEKACEMIVSYNVDDPSELKEGEVSLFTGFIKYKLPGYIERLRILKQVNYKISNGEMLSEDLWETSIRLAELAMNLITEVNIVRREDGYVFDSVNTLQYDVQGSAIISRIGNRISSGITLGKN